MKYITGPFKVFTTKKYVLDGNEVKQTSLLGDSKQITIDDKTEVSLQQRGVLSTLFGAADVTIANRAQSQTYEKSMKAKAFRAAILNVKEAGLKAEEKAKQEEYDRQYPWYEGLTEADLSDEIIIVRGLPQNFWVDLWYAGGCQKMADKYGVKNEPYWDKTERWVKQGEIFFEDNVNRYKAPVGGVLVGCIYNFDNSIEDRIRSIVGEMHFDPTEIRFFQPIIGRTSFTQKDFNYIEPLIAMADKMAKGKYQTKTKYSLEHFLEHYDQYKTEPLKTISAAELLPYRKDAVKQGRNVVQRRSLTGQPKPNEPGNI